MIGARVRQGWKGKWGRFLGRRRSEWKSEVYLGEGKAGLRWGWLCQGLVGREAWGVGGLVYMEASLCCLLQGGRGRDVSLCQVSHPPAHLSLALTLALLTIHCLSSLSSRSDKQDSASKRNFSLLSWQTLLLASWGFWLLETRI